MHAACLDLVVKALDYQTWDPLKTTRWFQGRLNLASFRGRSNEYLKFLGLSGKN